MSILETPAYEFNSSSPFEAIIQDPPDPEQEAIRQANLLGDTMLDGYIKERESASLDRVAELIGRVAVGRPEKIDGTEGFYNPAVWRHVAENGDTYICMLGREVPMPAPGSATEQEFTADGEPIIKGGPDVGSTVLKVLGPDGKIVSSKVIYEPKTGEPSYEDFRALLLEDGSTLIFGLTVVEPDGTPYPGVLITTTEEVMAGTPTEPQIVRDLGSGDQTTPLDEEGVKFPGKNGTWIDQQSFMFREEGKENRHRLRVFSVKESVVEHEQYIELPKNIKWGEWAMGTCGSPEWTDKTHQEAFTLIHGVTIVNGRYEYAAASARLFRGKDGLLAIDNIDPDPLMTSALFENVVQRHEGRNAFYTVGQIAHHDEAGNLVQLEVFGSPGDSRTDRVPLDPRERIKHWKRPELDEAT